MITKYIHSQDSFYKLLPTKSGETSLNLSKELLIFLSPSLSRGEETTISFKLYKDDYITAMAYLSRMFPLYTSSSTSSQKHILTADFFSDRLSEINSLFGVKDTAIYTVNLLYRQKDERIYLNNLEYQGFNIRHFLLAEHSKLMFSSLDNMFEIRLASGNIDWVIAEKNANTFAIAVSKFFLKYDAFTKLSKYFETSTAGYIQVNYNNEVLYRFLNPKIDDSKKGVKWDDEKIEWNGKEYLICKEWTPKRNNSSVPSLEVLKLLIESLYVREFAIDFKDGLYILERKRSNNETSLCNDLPFQQIFYGAPGTGKSHGTDEEIKKYYPTKEAEKDYVFRTTFHPDSDYSTFVGCYKPTKKDKDIFASKGLSEFEILDRFKDSSNSAKYGSIKARYLYEYLLNHQDLKKLGIKPTDLAAKLTASGFTATAYTSEASLMEYIHDWLINEGYTHSELTYSFVPQSFTKAYTAAWKSKIKGEGEEKNKPVFLVIEEINRGNCAQIFGDLFQLLDRKNGFSEYPIKPDTDLGNYLREEFEKAGLSSTEFDSIIKGEELLLPDNLYIWATMNTSDQSLFPIDSAFKRRWDWKYMPINTEAKEGWKIRVNGKEYSWSSFLDKINAEIEDTTSSEDKQMGFFFCKADDTDADGNNGVITAEKFVNKVLFYIYNDVFKDYGLEREFFKHKDGDYKGKVITFRSLYQMSGSLNEPTVAELLENLGVEEYQTPKDSSDEDVDNEDPEAGRTDGKHAFVAITVKGERLSEDDYTQFELYMEAIRRIGIPTIEPAIDGLRFRRHGCRVISKVKEDGIISSTDGFTYVEEGGYYFVKGINSHTMIRILEDLKAALDLDIVIEYR